LRDIYSLYLATPSVVFLRHFKSLSRVLPPPPVPWPTKPMKINLCGWFVSISASVQRKLLCKLAVSGRGSSRAHTFWQCRQFRHTLNTTTSRVASYIKLSESERRERERERERKSERRESGKKGERERERKSERREREREKKREREREREKEKEKRERERDNIYSPSKLKKKIAQILPTYRSFYHLNLNCMLYLTPSLKWALCFILPSAHNLIDI
jgi:hypothetical protein